MKLLGISSSSGQCFVKTRKGFTKMMPEICETLNQWIFGHPQVIQWPITNDTLLLPDRETGVVMHIPKLLIESLIRELHNDLIESPESGDLAEVRDAKGRVIISDSMLQCLLPPQLQKMSMRISGVIPRAAALMTATVTVTKAVQIMSKTSYVPSLPLCCAETFVVCSNTHSILFLQGANINVYIIGYWKKLKLACSHT